MLSLELKDLGKLPAVAAIIAKVGKVLALFWGRTRWPRKKLREVPLAVRPPTALFGSDPFESGGRAGLPAP